MNKKITVKPGTIKITKEYFFESIKKQYINAGLPEEYSTLLAEKIHQKIWDDIQKSKE